MDFTSFEVLEKMVRLMEPNYPLSANEMRKVLGQSQYTKQIYRDPLLRKLQVLGVCEKVNHGSLTYWSIDKGKLKSLLSEIRRVRKILRIFEFTTIIGSPRYE